jgi:hypothetical protein
MRVFLNLDTRAHTPCVQDFTAATKLLEPLFARRAGQQPSLAIRSAVGRIYLQSGYLTQAAAHFAAVEGDASVPQTLKDMNAALLACAEGKWQRADELLRGLVQAEPDNFVVSALLELFAYE